MDTAAEPRPGDEDFDGFRMRLPEDCVEYMLFVIGEKTDNSLPSLEAVRKAADQKLDELAKDYIWQREPFKLETKVQKGAFRLCSSVEKRRAATDHPLQVSDSPISTAPPTTETMSRTSG
jgi:hypothetical protein